MTDTDADRAEWAAKVLEHWARERDAKPGENVFARQFAARFRRTAEQMRSGE